jgi:putative ABC transport system permease protein
MNLIREFQLLLSAAFTSFGRNKIRTALTSLGIMIGVMSVVLLIALGLGLKNYISDQFESLGTNLVMVMPGNAFSGEGGMQNLGAGMMGGTEFTEDDVVALSRLAELQYVVPVFYKYYGVGYKNHSYLGYIMGTSEQYFDLMNLKTLAGETFTKGDVRRRSHNVILGYSLANNLFDDPSRAVGKTITISDDHYDVIGIAEKKGDPDQDSAIIIPYTTTFQGLNSKKSFFAIFLGVQNKSDIPAAKHAVETALLKSYEKDDFSVTESSEILGTINQIFNIINGVLVAIGSISLLVGGIGIMNIMYSSVTERTKEVGIRRAIGATKSDILWQFLTESVILSLFGGLLGLLLSALIVVLVHPMFPLALNALAVGIAFGVSTFIGIFFGVSPARRAANLPPIEAIRYE